MINERVISMGRLQKDAAKMRGLKYDLKVLRAGWAYFVVRSSVAPAIVCEKTRG